MDPIIKQIPPTTVIIPTSDRPREFLEKALYSVLYQSCKAAEVLVIDNGLNAARVDKSTFFGVTLIRVDSSWTAARARNYGAKRASGSFLAFLDDDDWWHRDFLKFAHQEIEINSAAAAYGRLDAFSEGRQYRYKCVSPDELEVRTILRRNPGTGGQNLVISKNTFLEVGGFRQTLATSHDRALAIDLLKQGAKIVPAPNAIAVRRDHKHGRLSHRPFARFRFLWEFRSYYSLFEFLGEVVTRMIQTGRLLIRQTGMRRDPKRNRNGY